MNTNPKSIDDVFTEVRATVNDTRMPYRFANTLLLSYYNTALNELYRYRPDLFSNLTAGVLSASVVPTYEITDLAQTPAIVLPVDARLCFNPIVYFVAGRLELSDDEFTDDGRTALLLRTFRDMLIGKGG